MNKLRPTRFKNMSVDMTALCDVAFLLLVFFVATARFDQWEPITIITPPTKTFNSYIPNDVLGVLYISGNKVMYQIVGDLARDKTLTEMAKKYHLSFSEREHSTFVNSPITGASICDLKQYDDKYMDWVHQIDRPGIPYATGDLDDNELFDWIKQSRLATRAFFSRDVRFIIKADQDVRYPVIKRVIDILQKQKVNRFSLMTEKIKKEI